MCVRRPTELLPSLLIKSEFFIGVNFEACLLQGKRLGQSQVICVE